MSPNSLYILHSPDSPAERLLPPVDVETEEMRWSLLADAWLGIGDALCWLAGIALLTLPFLAAAGVAMSGVDLHVVPADSGGSALAQGLLPAIKPILSELDDTTRALWWAEVFAVLGGACIGSMGKSRAIEILLTVVRALERSNAGARLQ